MRRWIFAIFLAALAGMAQAQSDTIEATIQRQIEAFRADDFATAFGYASPSIRGIFETPENFGAMVRGSYPMVWRPETVEFGALREVAGRLWQRVILRDAEGRLHALDYQMIETEGGWRINGVQLLQAPGVGA